MCDPVKTDNNKRYTATSDNVAPKKLTRAEMSQIKSDHHWEVVRPAEEAQWAALSAEKKAAKEAAKAARQNPAIHAHTALRVGGLIDYETDVEGEAEDVERLAKHNNDGALLVGGLLGVLVVVGAALVDAAAEKKKKRRRVAA